MDKRRILLIDDEETFTRVLKAYLEGGGRYEVRAESNGMRGLQAAREFHPDLILLDVIMPDLNGAQVAAELKADPLLKAIPVVFITAVVSREEASARHGLIGGQLFIAKPVSAKEVLACIERSMGTGSSAGAAPAPR